MGRNDNARVAAKAEVLLALFEEACLRDLVSDPAVVALALAGLKASDLTRVQRAVGSEVERRNAARSMKKYARELAHWRLSGS